MRYFGSDSFLSFIFGLSVSALIYAYKLIYAYCEFKKFKKMIFQEYAYIESLETIEKRIQNLKYLVDNELTYFNGELKYKYIRTVNFTIMYLESLKKIRDQYSFTDLNEVSKGNEESKKQNKYSNLQEQYKTNLNPYIKMKRDVF